MRDSKFNIRSDRLPRSGQASLGGDHHTEGSRETAVAADLDRVLLCVVAERQARPRWRSCPSGRVVMVAAAGREGREGRSGPCQRDDELSHRVGSAAIPGPGAPASNIRRLHGVACVLLCHPRGEPNARARGWWSIAGGRALSPRRPPDHNSGRSRANHALTGAQHRRCPVDWLCGARRSDVFFLARFLVIGGYLRRLHWLGQ